MSSLEFRLGYFTVQQLLLVIQFLLLLLQPLRIRIPEKRIHSYHFQARASIFHLFDEIELFPLRTSGRCMEPLQIRDQSRCDGNSDGTDHLLIIEGDRKVGNPCKQLFYPLHTLSRNFELQPLVQVLEVEVEVMNCEDRIS